MCLYGIYSLELAWQSKNMGGEREQEKSLNAKRSKFLKNIMYG